MKISKIRMKIRKDEVTSSKLRGGGGALETYIRRPFSLLQHPQYLFWVRGSKLSWNFWRFKPKNLYGVFGALLAPVVVLFQAFEGPFGPFYLTLYLVWVE
jgi:hypothetical protein